MVSSSRWRRPSVAKFWRTTSDRARAIKINPSAIKKANPDSCECLRFAGRPGPGTDLADSLASKCRMRLIDFAAGRPERVAQLEAVPSAHSHGARWKLLPRPPNRCRFYPGENVP